MSKNRASTQIVKLQARSLIEENPLETLEDSEPLAVDWDDDAWNKLATAVAKEIDDRGISPLGVDAPLSLARDDDGRPWEALAQSSMRTPQMFDPWPSGASKSQLMMARLWSEVAYLLTRDHGFTLWAGGVARSGKLLVEVETRTSWATLAASQSIPLTASYTRSVQVRQDIIDGIGLTFGRDVRPTKDLRDAAVAAITASRVQAGTAGYLGSIIETDASRKKLIGGGVAVPWLLR